MLAILLDHSILSPSSFSAKSSQESGSQVVQRAVDLFCRVCKVYCDAAVFCAADMGYLWYVQAVFFDQLTDDSFGSGGGDAADHVILGNRCDVLLDVSIYLGNAFIECVHVGDYIFRTTVSFPYESLWWTAGVENETFRESYEEEPDV